MSTHDMTAVIDEAACLTAHLGYYAIEPQWFARALSAIESGVWAHRQNTTEARTRTQTMPEDRIAVLDVTGPITKRPSKFSDASSLLMQRSLRSLGRDEHISGILLRIDSPGGQVDGIDELAEEVKAVGAVKPVHAFIEDMGASAAYWIASQASHVSANKMAKIGSIGAMLVIEDTSKAAEAKGSKIHVISTGKFKGAGIPGTPVTDDVLAEVQEIVDDVNSHFQAAIQAGRPDVELEKVSDGRLHMAANAMDLHLVDEISSFDAAVDKLRGAITTRRAPAAAAAARLKVAEISAKI